MSDHKGILTKYVFDDVQFALDVKAARVKIGLSREDLALAVGYESGATIAQIENANYGTGMPLRKYFAICNLLFLHPFDYIEIQPR